MTRQTSQPGCFITFEGIDGCGKTTVARYVEQHLRQRSIPAIMTREPGGTTIGNEIRQILLTATNKVITPRAELLLYAADRAQHVSERVLPALKQGRVVLSDRYVDASVAYQGYGRGFDLAWVETLMTFATGGLKPDLTVLLELDVAHAEERLRQRNQHGGRTGNDRLDAEKREFHERVRQGYLQLAQQEPDRIKIISASGTVEETCHSALQLVSTLIESRPGLGKRNSERGT